MIIRRIDQKIFAISDFCGKKPPLTALLDLTSLTPKNIFFSQKCSFGGKTFPKIVKIRFFEIFWNSAFCGILQAKMKNITFSFSYILCDSRGKTSWDCKSSCFKSGNLRSLRPQIMNIRVINVVFWIRFALKRGDAEILTTLKMLINYMVFMNSAIKRGGWGDFDNAKNTEKMIWFWWILQLKEGVRRFWQR